MLKIVTYLLLITVFYSFNHRAINYCFKLSDNTTVFIKDFDCEEKSESEKSNEKDEKKELSEYFLLNDHSLTIITQQSLAQHSKDLYATCDYSMSVYSPPEFSLI